MGKTATGAFKRYPALAIIGVAALLAILLPTALSVPRSDPARMSEFAPVPGSSKVGNGFSELGAGTSDGVGGGARSALGGSAGPPLAQRKPSLKRCVGSPPRQTEDPLSPPCVPFFEGGNGGATAKGVTDSEIVIVLFRSNSSQPRWEDLNAPITSNESAQTAAAKAFVRHFNERYQLYGRRLRAWFFHGGNTSTAEGIRAAIGEIDNERRPFAVIPMQTFGNSIAGDEAAQRGSLAVSFSAFARDFYRSQAPRIISFRPDLEDEAALAGSFICRRVANHFVKRGEVADRGKQRKLGILYSERSDEPNYAILADLLQKDLQDRCGLSVPKAATRSTSLQSGSVQENQRALASLRAEGVTTVAFYSGDALVFSNQAWTPEWFIPGSHGNQQIDSNDAARLLNQASWASAFGVSFDIRRDRIDEQAWVRAYREGCPSCGEASFGSDNVPLYEAMLMLMWGIQSAGPRLTHETLDRGMHAIQPRMSPNPYTPAAYFSPGNYSFVKDAMEIWWDPAGEDSSNGKRGCYRLPEQGSRFRPMDWNNSDLSFEGGICQGSFVK